MPQLSLECLTKTTDFNRNECKKEETRPQQRLTVNQRILMHQQSTMCSMHPLSHTYYPKCPTFISNQGAPASRCGQRSRRRWLRNRRRSCVHNRSRARIRGKSRVGSTTPAASLETIVQRTCRLVSILIEEGDQAGLFDLNRRYRRTVFRATSVHAQHSEVLTGAIYNFAQVWKLVSAVLLIRLPCNCLPEQLSPSSWPKDAEYPVQP